MRLSDQIKKLPALLAANTSSLKSGRHRIKKRHWCLGSLMILAGSWITHTTTATIKTSAQQTVTAEETFEISPATINDSQVDRVDSQIVLAHTNAGPENTLDIPEQKFELIKHKIWSGDSLGSIFKKHKFDLSLPYKISQHDVAKQLVKLSIGKTLTFKVDEEQKLRIVQYPNSALQNLIVEFDSGNVSNARLVDLPYELRQHTISGEISSSLYEAAMDAGLSIGIVMEMVRIFGWDIDFVLDIRAGDHFHVVYNDYMNGDKKLADGYILAAEFTTQGESYRAIRFEDDSGEASYYTPEGESMLGTFLRSPVEFSRISSRFGKRKHPILKTWRAHKGVDYAASTGTPIRATADGKVIHAGKKGGYGRTVILRHADRFSTLYAHMNGYAKGIRSGARVKQGQIIGYVGSSGLATGPHLHYEFRLDGVHRNPLTFKTPKASSVAAIHKTQFSKLAAHWEKHLDSTQQSYQLAKATEQTMQL